MIWRSGTIIRMAESLMVQWLERKTSGYGQGRLAAFGSDMTVRVL